MIFQPFIPFFGGKLAISPSLIITSRAERNLACLINKKDQQVYSRLSSTKEKLILSDLQTLLKGMYPSLGIEIKCQLPDSRPDIDLILYDRENAALAMVEVKWLIPSDSIKEVFSRDEDIQKGLSQAKIVSDYYASNPVDVQKRAFGEEIPVKCAFTFVLTKNNIGSSNLKRVVPVIDQTSFLKLISISKGNLCVLKCLFDEEAFLPKEGIDWALMTVETKYAGYTLTGPGFLMDPQPSDLLKKKVSRNDPCPCGKINEVTKKPMKYKKCCGK